MGDPELLGRGGDCARSCTSAPAVDSDQKLKALRSKTAIRVKQEAHPTCMIWFVCKGNLIYTREGSGDGFGIAESPMSRPVNKAYQQLSSLPQGPGESVAWFANPTKELFGHRPSSGDLYSGGETFSASPCLSPTQISVTLSMERTEGGKIDPWETKSRRGSTNSQGSSSSTSDEVLCNPDSLLPFNEEDNEDGSLVLQSVPESDEDLQFFSASNELEDEVASAEVYDKLQRVLREAENSEREAYNERCRRRKAEVEVGHAVRLAKSSELLYAREVRRKIEIEEELDRIHLEFGTFKNQQDVICEELQKLNEQNSALELQVVDTDDIVKNIEGKLSVIQYSLHSLHENNKVLQGERDNVVRKVRELRRKNEQKLISDGAVNFPYFSCLELQEATRDFDVALKVGEDEFENVYKGWLRNAAVIIKILNPQGTEVLPDFLRELNVLCRLRHPNIVALLGACPEAFTLVYEFLPNGSLEDRLVSKRNTPFTWQARTRIATEICSALIFLHSSKPYPVVHGDLKPSNILLDANYVSKLSDTCISHLVGNYVTANSTINTRIYSHSHLKDTFTYMDPVFLATGELTPLSDVYSFGVILLHLLTGRRMLGIVREVQEALEKGFLHEIIDPSAGNWPFSHAKQLAQIGLKCCEMNLKNRPDLASEVWSSLNMMMKPSLMTVPSLSFLSDSEDIQIPSYFICPILQDVMKDPRIAADGFTYEAKALNGWFNSGHDTSPMTNLKLPHCNLIPNHALRLAIREWLQQQA
ncbi:U-box domain-containing protein 33-like isoform X3 [Dioscorea cayenensis subsp. rotundata]|uniref:RING-type E3 ubiquitin transferase n=1 Tax=Dioscorea cayennensis subsp. rotundata TaxID=55577 RepID=A0AB40CSD0_DIOCR|nr:U-box domain-containing protein 33-like isoform X3 [Dioscorea cayenensis subsp. rotundata]